jgi:amino acid permease
MLGILLIYFMAKPFYSLAEEHDKNKWLYAIMGVGIYYLGTIIGGIILGIFLFVSQGIEAIDNLQNTNETILGLICVPFGLAVVWVVHHFLKKHLERKYEQPNDDNINILDRNL